MEGSRTSNAVQATKSPVVREKILARNQLGPQPGTSADALSEERDEITVTREKTDNIVLQAEQFRAQLHAPKGNCNNTLPILIDEKVQFLQKFDDDDDFFPRYLSRGSHIEG